LAGKAIIGVVTSRAWPAAKMAPAVTAKALMGFAKAEMSI